MHRTAKKFPQSESPLDITVEFYNDLGDPLDYKRLMTAVEVILERAGLNRELRDIREYPTRDRGQITYRFSTPEDADTAMGFLGSLFMTMPDEVGYRVFTNQKARHAMVVMSAMQTPYHAINDLLLLANDPSKLDEKYYRKFKDAILAFQDMVGKQALKKPKDQRAAHSKKLVDQLVNMAYPEAHSTQPKPPLKQIGQQVFRIWRWLVGERVMDTSKDWTKDEEAPQLLPVGASVVPRRIKYRGATYVRV